MFWSLGPLVLGCLLIAGLVGTCSFAPGRTNRGPVPSYNAAAALRADAASLGFPIRIPQVPAGWQANSGGRGGIDGGRIDPATGARLHAATSTVGYITSTGLYMAVTQSDADEGALVNSIHSSSYASGSVEVSRTHWVVYKGVDKNGGATEPIWTARLSSPAGPSQVAITGAGAPEDYRTLAEATQSQSPLPAR